MIVIPQFETACVVGNPYVYFYPSYVCIVFPLI